MKKLGLLVLSLMVAFVLAACAPAADAMAHNDAMAGEDAMAEKDAMAGDAMMEASYTATLSGAAEVPPVETAATPATDAKAGDVADATKPAGDAAKKQKSDDELKAEREKAWRDKLAQANLESTRLQGRADVLQRALNDLSTNLYGSTRATQASELEQVQLELAATRKSVEDLQEEGRRNGYR